MRWESRARATAALAGMLVAGCRGDDSPARVTIPAGATMRAAAESLSMGGVIRFPALFSAYAKARSSDRGIKAGTYVVAKTASWNSILGALRGGGEVITVLVPEGLTLSQIEAVLVAKLGVPADSAAAATRDTALLRRLDVPTGTVEGYLFPDTYFFPPGTSARTAVATMVRRFEQQWKPEWVFRLDSISMSRHDVMTLASIVEREAKRPEERPIIAAVYMSRLHKGMLLQADPTVQYALPQYQKRLLNKHLLIDSPYNTYRHAGLPPGPIGAPGVASIRAALYPANVPYLYFVAFPDGHHEFRVSLEQHQLAARQARRAWNALKAKQEEEARKSAAASRPGE
ncbi:MAG TPA: endolytic transglycosylase MltG [Gemmatimonadaceae bacterium]